MTPKSPAQLWYKIHIFDMNDTKITTGRRKKLLQVLRNRGSILVPAISESIVLYYRSRNVIMYSLNHFRCTVLSSIHMYSYHIVVATNSTDTKVVHTNRKHGSGHKQYTHESSTHY